MPRVARVETPEQEIGQPSVVSVDPIVVTDDKVMGGAVHESAVAKTERPEGLEPAKGVRLISSKDEAIYTEGLTGPDAMVRAKELAFNEELVTIRIFDSPNQNDENPVPISVDGRGIFVYRNTPTIVKRYYVERLARAKLNKIGQRQSIDNEGNRSFVYPKTHALKYDFSVEDDTQIGRDWLRKILSEPA